MAWSGTVDSAKARWALSGWAALMAPEVALRTAVTRWVGRCRGDSAECRGAMPEDGIDASDPGRGDRPTLGTGLRSTASSFIHGGVVLFQRIVRVEHSNWLILGERASWPK